MTMFTESDLQQLKDKGITPSAIETQLQHFKQGFPYLELQGSATPGHGMLVPDEADEAAWLAAWQGFLKGSGRVLKFVPASGAASRMFKDLYTFLDAAYEVPTTKAEVAFFKGIKDFAFYEALEVACRRNEGTGIDALVAKGAYKAVVRNLLMPQGLNYGALPKGLLLFHRYPGAPRTSVVEHLVEGALYACNAQREVNLHFTVSPEHLPLFEAAVQATAPALEALFGLKYNVSFSVQKSATDTLAATADNQPFREDGRLVFRPGGHGSLIENLNDLDADIVFIKNIDNVVPDRLKDTTVRYKQVLAGLLVQLRERTFNYLNLLDSGHYTHDQLVEIIQFLQRNLCTRYDDTKLLEDAELAVYLRHKLNRPIRVCGMVRNQGEPGGGPFWTYNQDGSYSLQILESSQIDLADPAKKALFEQGTHFNPVDLVCSLTDYKGERFNLPDYVDEQTGFISEKSKGGKVLKALERPGLWNGAMSDWNTVFVEVPLLTFNPVKTVNDLLRPEHQPA